MSWISYESDHPFPIQNLPYGTFTPQGEVPRPCTRIGDFVVDLSVLAGEGIFDSIPKVKEAFSTTTLNAFMALPRATWTLTRATLQTIFARDEAILRDNASLRAAALVEASSAQMGLPCNIGDYTDFYASEEHATNLGKMFRPGAAPLMPNWKYIPIGYHGRASSIVPSGVNIHRPNGQTIVKDGDAPTFGPSARVDFEIEIAAYVGGPENPLGTRLTFDEARDRIFGLSLFNDWSARDMQRWEYVPLGPFLAKSFGSTISPWIVTIDALEPFLGTGPAQDPTPLPYLRHPEGAKTAVDLEITCEITPEGGVPKVVSTTNMKYMYWSIFQQLVHHASNGCNMRAGDVLATGTISGPTDDSLGSMIEMSWMGTRSIPLADGVERKFLLDNDTVTLRGECRTEDYRIGFGEATCKILPAIPFTA